MNEKLKELFNLYKNLRSAQKIVEEILALDYYVYHYDEERSIALIDHVVKSYKNELKLVFGLRRDNQIIVENDETLYESKDEEDINGDVMYVRDSLIIIGAVKTGIRQSLREVVEEVYR